MVASAAFSISHALSLSTPSIPFFAISFGLENCIVISHNYTGKINNI